MNVTFHGVSKKPSIVAVAEDLYARKLSGIDTNTELIIEKPHKSHHSHNHFQVTIKTSVPRLKTIVCRKDGEDLTHLLHVVFDVVQQTVQKEHEKRIEKQKGK